MERTSHQKVKKLVGLALFTAIMVVLQIVASAVRFGPFSITLVLAPLVVGAALYGVGAGAYLGAVFGAGVLISGDANLFMVVDPVGTVVTVMLKGIAAGLAAAAVYKMLEKKNRHVAVLAAGIASPLANTAVFVVGCFVFFLDTVTAWGADAGFGSAWQYILFGMVGLNFLVELAINLLICNVVFRLIKIGKKE